MTGARELHPSFQHREYLFRRKVFKLFGGAFHVYDENRNLVFYAKQKAFRLREDFRVYSDERQTEELLIIKTQQIFEEDAIYNVYDPTRNEVVGALRRKWFRSIVVDEWSFLSPEGREIGKLTESSIARALLSRFITFIPQTYIIVSVDGRKVAEVKQHFNPFVLKYSMTIVETNPSIDRRLLISAGILLAGIEGLRR